MMTRPMSLVLPTMFLVSFMVGIVDPRIGFADSGLFAPAPTVLGQTGVVAVNSPDVLSPWQSRFGIGTFLATGSGGNRFDLLLSDAASRDQVVTIRGALALGLPRGLEAAVTVPYAKVESDNVSTDGVGDVTVSAKLKVLDQSGWIPATAVSASLIAQAADKLAVSSVTTNGYLASVSTQLALASGSWAWTMIAEVGGFWRDLGRSESNSSLVYGVASIVPLGKTGFAEDTGEVQLIAEINGTFARQDVAGQPDDATSFAPGLRYVTKNWGTTATGALTTYEQGNKKSSAGALVEFHVVF